MSIIKALWIRNLKAFWRNKPALIFNLIFPFFFIFVFGEIFRMDGMIENPEAFMLAGIIIATVFDSAFRVSTNTIDDITSGFMKEVLVSPISRLNIAIGQFISSATIATVQGLIIFVIGFFIGLRVTSPLTIVYALLAMVFIGLVFAGFGLLIATRTKNMQTFQAVSIAITMPMSFISGAYIAVTHLPIALRWVSLFNPLTYAVVLFRTIALEHLGLSTAELVQAQTSFTVGGFTVTPFISVMVLLGFGAIFLALSTISFTKTDFSKMNRNKNDGLEGFD